MSLSLGGTAWAVPQGDEPVRVEVFTALDLPIQPMERGDSPSAPMSIEVYVLDAIESFEAKLSERLPSDPEAAKRDALERLGRVDRQQADAAQRAATGLLKAAEYGIDRYPAIVIDGQAVVYGVTDMAEALRLYENQQGRAPR